MKGSASFTDAFKRDAVAQITERGNVKRQGVAPTARLWAGCCVIAGLVALNPCPFRMVKFLKT